MLKRFFNIFIQKPAQELQEDKRAQELQEDSFWSDSYFIASTGQVSLDILMQYVESQVEK